MDKRIIDWVPQNKRERGEEKKKIIFEWICIFQYSNQAILMELLGLKHPNNSAYFKKLDDSELLQRLTLPTLRNQIFMLSRNSLSLLTGFEYAGQYSTDPRRVSASLARHNLAVQRSILSRRALWDSVIPERLLKERGKKVPDAILIKDNIKTALEIELTLKTKNKIYLAFTDHARAYRDGLYNKVIYVFDNQRVRDTYQAVFDEEAWPVFRFSQAKKRYVEDAEKFNPKLLPGFKESVSFEVEKLLHD